MDGWWVTPPWGHAPSGSWVGFVCTCFFLDLIQVCLSLLLPLDHGFLSVCSRARHRRLRTYLLKAELYSLRLPMHEA